MLVFDRFPDLTDYEYVVDVMSSTPAGPHDKLGHTQIKSRYLLGSGFCCLVNSSGRTNAPLR
jgi:hypothetical protein